MKTPQSLQELDDFLLDGDLHGRQSELASYYATLADLAQPDDAVSRGELLVAAAEQYRLAGDLETSVSLCRRAVADGGPVRLDARAYLLAALVASGETQEARTVVKAIWADRSWDPYLLLFVGEQLEIMDDLNAAATWFTRGVVRPVHDSRGAVALLLWARTRVRGKLGFPPDDFDLLADELRAEYVNREVDSEPQPSRKGACPCGSGRKSKRCCGAGAALTAVTTYDGDQVVIDLISH